MATVNISTADEFIAAFKTYDTDTTINITDDIDLNDNILESNLTMTGNIIINGNNHIIKNLQATGNYYIVFNFVKTFTKIIINDLQFENIYMPLSQYVFYVKNNSYGNVEFNNCEFYALISNNSLFITGEGSIDRTIFTNCIFSFENSKLSSAGFLRCTINGGYIKYKKCKIGSQSNVSDFGPKFTNVYFVGDMTITTSNPVSFIYSGANCIYNLDLSTNQSTAKTVNFAISFTNFINLYNTSKIGDNITIPSQSNLVGLSDADLKSYDKVVATGFPIVSTSTT